MATAKLVNHGGAPAIEVDGKILPPMAFTFVRDSDEKPRRVKSEYCRALGECGIKLYFIISNTEWTEPGSIDLAEGEILGILKENPDAYFIMRMGVYPPLEWVKENPDECVKYSDGVERSPGRITCTHSVKYPRMFSLCSDVWRNDAARALTEAYGILMKKPYADRIIGFFFCAGGTSDWYYPAPLTFTEKTEYKDTGGFDHGYGFDYTRGTNEASECYGDLSPAFEREFSRYLKAKYGTNEALRAAWCDPEADIDEPKIPGTKERYYVDGVDADVTNTRPVPYGSPRREPPTNGTNIGHFADMKKHRDVFDFYRALHLGTAETIIHLGKTIKEISDGRMLTGAFYGAEGSTRIFDYSNVGGVYKILESPYVDMLSSPELYENRQPGAFAGTRQTTDSFALNGKIVFSEDDERTHLDGDLYRTSHECYTAEDTVNILKRTFGRDIAENTYGWWFEQQWNGGGRFSDEKICDVFKRQQKVAEEAYAKADRTRVSEIAFIYDEESYHVISSECTHVAVELFRGYEIDRIGAPTDRYFHNDLANPDMPDYKLYVFVNTLYLTDAEREVIKNKLKRNNATALFLYGAGVINPDREDVLSAKNTAELVGMDMELRPELVSGKFKFCDKENKFNKYLDRYAVHGELSRKMWANNSAVMTREKNSRNVLYPGIWCTDGDAECIAYNCETEMPAISVKKQNGYTSVYCASRYVSADVIRGVADFAGCHIWSTTDDVTYIGRNYVTIHASSTGKKLIALPESASAFEVYENKFYSKDSTELTVDMKFGETKMFELK